MQKDCVTVFYVLFHFENVFIGEIENISEAVLMFTLLLCYIRELSFTSEWAEESRGSLSGHKII